MTDGPVGIWKEGSICWKCAAVMGAIGLQQQSLPSSSIGKAIGGCDGTYHKADNVAFALLCF